MPRILHTADLHLAPDRPERWRALEALVEIAGERRADALLVAGDLLDRAGDHAALRSRARETLEGLDAPTLLLPGNHDRTAYAPGQDWGGGTRLLVDEPVHVTEVDGLRVAGVPFPAEPGSFRRVRRAVRDELSGGRPSVLALHGTLIDAAAPRIQDESREDEPGEYFPVRTGELRGIGASYVALGHYHQHEVRSAGEVPLAYPGSPSPVGSNAWGPRSALLVSVGAEVRVERVGLPVPYRDRLERWLTPFREERELAELEDELRGARDDRCHMRVRVDGVLAGISEEELRERLEGLRDRLGGSFRELEFRRESVGLDPGRAELFREFRQRLEDRGGADGGEGGTAVGPEVRRRALELGARALKD